MEHHPIASPTIVELSFIAPLPVWIPYRLSVMPKRGSDEATTLLASSINDLVLNELRHIPNISGRDVVRSNNGNKRSLGGWDDW